MRGSPARLLKIRVSVSGTAETEIAPTPGASEGSESSALSLTGAELAMRTSFSMKTVVANGCEGSRTGITRTSAVET